MPEIVHECGSKLRFPPGSEGRRGKCPHCGQPVEVPRAPAAPGAPPTGSPGGTAAPGAPATPTAANSRAPGAVPGLGAPASRVAGGLGAPAPRAPVPPARSGLAPRPRPAPEAKIILEPPPRWAEYLAFLESRGPALGLTGLPANIMLKTEADAKWAAAEAKGPPSKFVCPGCKLRLDVGAIVCLGCGLDLRTGKTVDGKTALTEAGLDYLKKIPWLADAPPPEAEGPEKKPRTGLGKRRRPRRLG